MLVLDNERGKGRKSGLVYQLPILFAVALAKLIAGLWRLASQLHGAARVFGPSKDIVRSLHTDLAHDFVAVGVPETLAQMIERALGLMLEIAPDARLGRLVGPQEAERQKRRKDRIFHAENPFFLMKCATGITLAQLAGHHRPGHNLHMQLLGGLPSWAVILLFTLVSCGNPPPSEDSRRPLAAMIVMGSDTEVRRVGESTHLIMNLRYQDTVGWSHPSMLLNSGPPTYELHRVRVEDFVALFSHPGGFGDQPQELSVSPVNPEGGPPKEMRLTVSNPVLEGQTYPYKLRFDVHTDWETIQKQAPSSETQQFRAATDDVMHWGSVSAVKMICFGCIWHRITHNPVTHIITHNPVTHAILHGVEQLPADVVSATHYVVEGADYIVDKTKQGFDELRGDMESLDKDFQTLGKDIENGAEFLAQLAAAWVNALKNAWADIKCDLIKVAMDVAVAANVASNAAPGAAATDVEWAASIAAAKSLGKQGVNTLLGPLIGTGIAMAGGNKAEQGCGTGLGEAALVQMESPTGTEALNTRGFFILVGKQVMLAENQCGGWLAKCF